MEIKLLFLQIQVGIAVLIVLLARVGMRKLSYRPASGWAAVPGIVVIFILTAMIFTVRSDAQEQHGDQPDGNRQDIGRQNENGQYDSRQSTGQWESGNGSCTGSDARMIPEGNSSVIKGIGASPDMISLCLTLAQSSPNSVLECWARAFTDRNGDILYRLAADRENFKQWEMAAQRSDGSFAFGNSSPWPWDYDYEITAAAEDLTAEITFHMRTSVPEIYLLKEKVRITEFNGLYYVDHDSTWDNYNIDTEQKYREICDEESAYGDLYSQMAALYDDSFYRAILTQLMKDDNPEFYQRFTDPVSAAEALLHLGEGTGEVTGRNMIPVTDLKSEDAIPPGWTDMQPPGWIKALSVAGEGSRVIVSYTFARDGSRIEIPMELKEGSQGIWGLVGGSIREIYSWTGNPEMAEQEEGKAGLPYVIELSNYGIYRFGAYSGYTCLWPEDVGPEAAAWVYEDKLYIFESLERAGKNSDGEAEVVLVLDPVSGELHREHLAIPRNYEHIFPEVSFGIDGGFVHIYGLGSKMYSLPLENLNETLWNHKTFRQMSEEDKQAYGVENREFLLSNPGTLVRLSVREPEKTSAYIDLNGDGVSEQVILAADPGEEEKYWGAYRLQAGESVLTGWGSRLHNDIWVYSPDGEQIILALYEDGPSGDPCTYLFDYEDGELNALGEFYQDIRECTIKDGVISGTVRCEVIQTDAIHAVWQIGSTGKLEPVPQKVYDFAMLNDIELLEELPVQNMLPADAEGTFGGIRYFAISPQTVHFLQTDSTFSWIRVEAADGSRGWFRTDGRTVEALGKDCTEVFGNLFLAD